MTIPAQYHMCRTLRNHAWEYTTVDKEKGGIYKQGLLCVRCTVQRAFYINGRTGAVVKRSGYKYPKDYQVKGGLKAKELDDMRLSELKALLAQ